MVYVFNLIYLMILVAASPWLLWRYVRQGKNRRGWGQKILGWVPECRPVHLGGPETSQSLRPGDPQPQTTTPLPSPTIWFHAVSVGEVNLLGPVIERLRLERPHIKIVISTTTETGYDLALGKYPEHTVFFFPFDFSWAIKNALRRLRPAMIVLAELEIWPNFIRIASRFPKGTGLFPNPHHQDETTPNNGSPATDATVKLAVINGRLSKSSFRGYQRFRWLLKSSFQKLDWVAAQNQTYADRFVALGCDPDQVTVTGSVKFDGVQTDRGNPATRQLAELAQLETNEVVFLAGSTQLEEDLLAARVYQKLKPDFPQLRLILAPRHPERVPHLVTSLEKMGLKVRRRSELTDTKHRVVEESGSPLTPNPSPPRRGEGSQFGAGIERTPSRREEKNQLGGGEGSQCNDGDDGYNRSHDILIVDLIGELRAWWGVADLAFVGGSLGSRGGQNMIEPAAYGIPVSFGPNTNNFREIVSLLLAAKAATVVHDEADLAGFVEKVLTEPEWAQRTGRAAQAEIQRHRGASDRTVAGLLRIVDGGKS